MKIAVVTGASSGMGREFVMQLDRDFDFDQIWVIARREERLRELCDVCKTQIIPLPLDLTCSECIEELGARLKSEKPEIGILVNGSGYGKFGAFADITVESQLGMIDLNTKALIAVTHACLPYMKNGSQILNIGSLSAFQPVPYINVYAATKAFVLSFSRSLGVELMKSGIHVMAVCPGWVRTEFFERAVCDDTIKYYNKFFTSDQVVMRALRDMKKKKDVSVCGLSIRNQVRLVKLLPHRLVMKIWCKQQGK